MRVDKWEQYSEDEQASHRTRHHSSHLNTEMENGALPLGNSVRHNYENASNEHGWKTTKLQMPKRAVVNDEPRRRRFVDIQNIILTSFNNVATQAQLHMAADEEVELVY